MARWYFVPSDWEMSEDLLSWTRDKGLTDKVIEEELESFRDHQYKKPMMRPDACWRNWVKNGLKWGTITPVVVPQYRQPAELTDEEKERNLKQWKEQMRRFGK